MKKPYVLGFYGKSNTGKTTLIIDLIKHFKNKDFNIATVKISDKKISFDNENKDSYNHYKAGSELVVLSSKIETDFLVKHNLSIEYIIKKITNFSEFDLIFIEGANDEKIDKIRIGDIKERKNTIHTYYGDFLRLVNLIIERINMEIE